jgi:hypothetical protein
MKNISLCFYQFSVFKTVKKNGKETEVSVCLDDINGESIANCVYTFLRRNVDKYEDDKEKEKVYKPDSAEVKTASINNHFYFGALHAIIKSGDYGIEVEIVDPETGEKTHTQAKKEAGVMPFGFSIYYSKISREGILISQTFGNRGMFSHLKGILEDSVRLFMPNASVIVKCVVPDIYFQNLMNSKEMQSIVVETKKKTTKDLDEQCPLVDYESREHVYKKPIFKIGYKEKLINLFTKREPLAIINGLVDPDEAVENVKINFKSNSRYKTVNYLTYFSLKVAEDITGSVKTNIETGHPQKESLFEQMDKKAIFYMEDLNIIMPKSSHESIDYIGDSFFYLKSDEVVEKNVSAVKS